MRFLIYCTELEMFISDIVGEQMTYTIDKEEAVIFMAENKKELNNLFGPKKSWKPIELEDHELKQPKIRVVYHVNGYGL